MLLAGQHDEFDRRLIVKQAPAYGIVGKKITLTLRVQDEPQPRSATAIVSFSRDDGSSQTMTVPVNQDMPFDVTVDHPGNNLFAFETAEVSGELTTLNNSTAVSVNGIRDRLRVLLVSGEPHIGGRTWRDLLKADPAVDLIHFTILRSPMKISPVPSDQMSLIAFPVKELFEDKLHSFDLVIFDRFSNRSLIPDQYLKNIAQYVEDGGSLLVSSATFEAMPQLSTSPLAEVLPATPTGNLLTGAFVPQVTPTGLRDPVTAVLNPAQSQWGPWLRQIEAHADKGEVLMSGLNNAPLLILAHAGKGRVAEFLSDQFWLWARDYQGGGPQGELLRRVSHWLVGEPALSETALHATAKRVDGQWQLAITRQSLHDNMLNVVVTGPDNQPSQIKLSAGAQPGVLSATTPAKSIGLYHIKDDQQEILAWVGASDMPDSARCARPKRS